MVMIQVISSGAGLSPLADELVVLFIIANWDGLVDKISFIREYSQNPEERKEIQSSTKREKQVVTGFES